MATPHCPSGYCDGVVEISVIALCLWLSVYHLSLQSQPQRVSLYYQCRLQQLHACVVGIDSTQPNLTVPLARASHSSRESGNGHAPVTPCVSLNYILNST
jgi:hypothetical protein